MDDGNISLEKRMGNFEFSERTTPRMGKRMHNPGKDKNIPSINCLCIPCLSQGSEEEGVSIENVNRRGDFGFSEKTRSEIGKRMFDNGRKHKLYLKHL